MPLRIRYSKRNLLIFLIVLTVVNLIQADSSELILDEAYYWYFSQELEFGYFDHPPLVALLVAIGSSLFSGELGVRFFAPVLFTATVWLLWKIQEDDLKYDHFSTFIWFMCSVALFNVYGFFMVPDTPLVFFAALFLFGYKRYLKTQDWWSVVFLAVSMAGMMYSKYMAILLIGFILLSNLRLLLEWRFLLAAVFSLALYSPHFYWLYQNDFVSLKYHLVDRANSQYKLSFTLDYLLGFLVISGLTFPLVFKAFFKHRIKTVFDRGLVLTVVGIFVFFLFSSFNRRTQAQWPLLVLLPLVIITFEYALRNQNFRKWLNILSVVTVIILGYLRIAICFQDVSPIIYETHGNKATVMELKNLAGDLPVVYRNSYTEASMYMFYSGGQSFSLNGYPFRPNQFDLRNEEDKYRHKRVVYLSTKKTADSSFGVTRLFRNRVWRGIIVDDFVSWRRLAVTIGEDTDLRNQDSVDFSIYNPYDEKIPVRDLYFYGLTFDDKMGILDTVSVSIPDRRLVEKIASKDTLNFRAFIGNKSKLEDASNFRLCISERDLLPFGFQGNVIPVR